MPTMDSLLKRGRGLCILVAAAAAINACAGDQAQGMPSVDLTTASYARVEDLALASEYLLYVTVVDAGTEVVDAGSPPLGAFQSSAKIADVIAQRPDVTTEMRIGEEVQFVQVLVSDSQVEKVGNPEDFSSESFPGEESKLQADQRYVVFGVDRTGDDGIPLVEVVAWALATDDSSLKFGGFPGELAGASSSYVDLQKAATLFSRAAPWRQVSPDANQPPPTNGEQGRPPNSVAD